MKVLMIGAGGREHALAWKLSQTAKVQTIYVAPGNAGTARTKKCVNIPFNGVHDIEQLCTWALKEDIDLTVVGPEAPLAAGVVDVFRSAGLRIFGPTQAAAQLESSKAFSKDFMRRHGIPTADYAVFEDAQSARDYIRQKGAPIVVKADGLAAGKGVVVAATVEEACQAVDALWRGHPDGKVAAPDSAQAGTRVVVEEFLQGEEASFIVVCDGKNVVPLASSQDHKRLLDGDLGPNTGGMGAYSPAPVLSPKVYSKALREIILPTVRAMKAEGIPFSGFLYAGLMISPSGEVKTLEFNCRMGDPETQAIMMRLDSDLFDLIWKATEGKLDGVELQWLAQSSIGVVMAAEGYPDKPLKGASIHGLPEDKEDLMVFHAGTRFDDTGENVLVDGGRVLCVTALASTIRQAQQKAYARLQSIHFEGMQFRKDIASRAIKPKEA